MKQYFKQSFKIATAILMLTLLAVCCQATDIYVSVNGNDHNPGTKQSPFASIARAQLQVQKIKGPVTVYLRGGVYYLTRPIVFTAKDSRGTMQKVVYKAYPGEKVIISGSTALKLNWTPYKDGIMQANIDRDLLFDRLFINGQLQRMARYPNYNPNIGHFGGFAEDAISAERVKKWQNPAGGYIHALHESEWGGLSYLITGKDVAGNLTMEGGFQNNRPSAMHKTYRFVENIFEELDTAGEWYFDKGRHILYCWPPHGVDLNKAVIATPQLEELVEFKGTSDHPVTNISLQGLELTQTLRTFMKNKEPLLRGDWTIYRKGSVTMEGTTHCAVKDCFFNSVGGNAMVFSNYNRESEISGCHIAEAGSSGIVFVGSPGAVRSPLFRYEESNDLARMDKTPVPKTPDYPASCLAYNNLIENIGRVEKQVAGVEIAMAMNITVSHNSIYNVPRAGININDGTWGGHLIEYNDVFNTVLETGDHGSFNSWGRDRYWYPDRKMMDSIVALHPALILLDAVKPTIIRNNRFRCDHGWDIDLDDGSSNYEIYNNVLLNGGLKFREGFFRKAYNNVIINNSFHPHVWFKNSGDIFTRNIIASAYFPIGIVYWGKEVDHNFFTDALSLSKQQARRTDQHSLSGNPLFAGPAAANYTVGKGSPALKTGYKNFPMGEFGVVSPRLKAIAQRPAIPVIASAIRKTARKRMILWAPG